MINLQPIARNIQKRLLEKMRVLGRTSSTAPGESTAGEREGLTHTKLAIRTPFLRMTSGQPNAVTLMGGKLKDDGTLAGGYDEIYGTRTYKKRGTEQTKDVVEQRGSVEFGSSEIVKRGTGTFNQDKNTVNKGKLRPMPGLKSADIVFKGSMGLRSLREATISWTCWDWAELDELMPHFLAHGQTVLLQWGWVYDKQSLQEIPTYLKSERGEKFIDASAYKNYQKKVNELNGDFDMMVGIIKNFEFTTRDDGGFDCQTIITSVGHNILENPEPSSTVGDPSLVYNLSLQDDSKFNAERIKDATGDEGAARYDRVSTGDGYGKTKDIKRDIKPDEISALIKLNSNITFKSFISQIDEYLKQDIKDAQKTDPIKTDRGFNYTTTDNFQVKPGKYILHGTTTTTEKVSSDGMIRYNSKDIVITNGWIRWGWFEDNILSKFLTLTNESEDNTIVSSFRSIENIIDSDGNPTNQYKSVEIKNHERLETVNIQDYILPGQFNVIDKHDIYEGEELLAKIPGDLEQWQQLSSYVNSTDYFEPFTTKYDTGEATQMYTSGAKFGDPGYKSLHQLESEALSMKVPPAQRTQENFLKNKVIVKNFDTGYLRNMLINTKLIKEAFGADDVKQITVENISIYESLENLFSLLNKEINFWNFSITNDTFEPNRTKIIDEQVTAVDFTKKNPIRTEITQHTNFNIKKNVGIFEFPVWKSTSFIKRQNISAKIPDAMQLAIMYGANADKLKEFSNFGSKFGDSSAVAAGMLYGKQKSGLDIAILNDFSQKIGNASGEANQDLNPNNKSDDVLTFIKKNITTLELTYEDRLKRIDENLKTKYLEKIDGKLEAWEKIFDESKPPPLFNYLSNLQKKALFLTYKEAADELNLPKSKLDGKPLLDYRDKNAIEAANEVIGNLFGSKFDDDGKMKPRFTKSVKYYTTITGLAKTNNNPILIPLELELDIDGIGGIYPGNSFHSSYVPRKYKNTTVFQAFDVNHRVSNEGWTVTLTGKMRTSIGAVLEDAPDFSEQIKEQLKNYEIKAKIIAQELIIKQNEDYATLVSAGAP